MHRAAGVGVARAGGLERRPAYGRGTITLTE
jgi:hypothetical protein